MLNVQFKIGCHLSIFLIINLFYFIHESNNGKGSTGRIATAQIQLILHVRHVAKNRMLRLG
jgi:hypothetical protein